jgi:Cytochrome c3
VRAQNWWYGFVAVASAGLTGAASAQVNSLERLVMPGPLSTPHADLEATCGSCHKPFSRELQNSLCLDCHEDVARDLTAKTGFHGRASAVTGASCATCHSEHMGRAADILHLDEDKFDHDVTNFPLHGKHAETKCAECHTPELKSFHAAETECNACHAKDDRHHGNLGTACADCHAETAWKDVHFDHAQKTDYALTGAHARITCVSCHAEEKYDDTPKTCIGCHAADDHHKGNNGVECQQCHTTKDWKELSFDHFTRTGFALRGGHSGLKCEACHEGNKLEKKAPKECIGCHAEDDTHAGVNGTECAQCHRVTRWPDVTFDHGRDTKFALLGAHANLTCVMCHEQPASVVKPPMECFGCHEEDDPHREQLGKACDSCHGLMAWTKEVRFDHDLARFPLLGKHDTVSCDACHETKAFLDAKEQCIDCHREDDVHKQRFGTACETCHNPNAWLAWQFDHDTETSFPLTGAHRGLDCHGCHREKVDGAIKLDSTCASCHRREDVHDGEFGSNCGRCHTTQSFTDLKEPR